MLIYMWVMPWAVGMISSRYTRRNTTLTAQSCIKANHHLNFGPNPDLLTPNQKGSMLSVSACCLNPRKGFGATSAYHLQRKGVWWENVFLSAQPLIWTLHFDQNKDGLLQFTLSKRNKILLFLNMEHRWSRKTLHSEQHALATRGRVGP